MNWELLKGEARKVWGWYLPLVSLLVIYLVGRTTPLNRGESWLIYFAEVQGVWLAYALMREGGQTRSFLWSRPVTRRGLFLHRWALGLFFQVLTLLIALVLLGGGVRSGLQTALGGLYHPMVRWHELNALWPLAVCSLLCYQTALFFRIYGELQWGLPQSLFGILIRGAALCIMAGPVTAMSVYEIVSRQGGALWAGELPYVYGPAFVALTTLGAAYGFNHLEAEA